MAIRTDIYSVDWSQSPRIVWIDISVTEGNAQDLYDTLRHLEAIQIDEDPIVDAGGWEPLGDNKFVGITVSLFNAQYAFADRPGPDWVICNMSNGNVVAFTDVLKQILFIHGFQLHMYQQIGQQHLLQQLLTRIKTPLLKRYGRMRGHNGCMGNFNTAV
jgi:hypothetical protein